MKKAGEPFLGRKSTVGRAAASRASLDRDLDSVLGGSREDDTFSASFHQEVKGKDKARRPSTKSVSGKNLKAGSLTSGSTDEDFYSSLAQMAGEGFDDDDDDDESISEADAKKMAESLADLDNLESDLFGESLGKKNTPAMPPSKTVPSSKSKTSGKTKPSQTESTSEGPKVTRPSSTSPEPIKTASNTPPPSAKSEPPGERSAKQQTPEEIKSAGKSTKLPKKFDFREFDEDDPLAGLGLSDEDEDIDSKPKTKKAPATKKKDSSSVTTQGLNEERPKSSRGRHPPGQDPGVLSPPVTKEQNVSVREDTDETPSSLSRGGRQRPPPATSGNGNDLLTSPPASPGAKPDSRRGNATSPATPQRKQAETSAAGRTKKAKEEISFDSDEDLPGLDDKTPRVSATPAQRKRPEKSSKQEPVGDLFGEDDNLIHTEVSNENSNKKSRFDELMGKKQSNEPKKQVPKSLDDFMANISGGKTDAQNATNKKVSSPTSDDTFQFGGYMPSAASTEQPRNRGGLARPDTAPGSSRRSVRFADDLSLDDEDVFSMQRPSTAPLERGKGRHVLDGSAMGPSEKNPPVQRRKENQVTEEYPERKEKPQLEKPKQHKSPGPKPSGGAGDWLGLADDDDDDDDARPEVSSTTSNTTASLKEREKDTSSIQGTSGGPERQSSPPRRAGRYREDRNDNEFLRMLGITPEDPSNTKQTETSKSSLLPWESAGGSPRRGRRLRAEGDHPFGPLDEQPPRPTGQGGPLPHKEDQANLPGGPLERPDSSDKRVLTAPSMEQRQTDKYHSVAPPAQEKSTSQQLAVASPAQTHPPTPGSTPLHPSHPQQFTETYATQTVPPQTFIPQQVGTQPITPQSIPTPLSTDQYHVIASQHPPQTPLHQVQYQTPTGYTPGYQPFPQAPPLNKLELAKPKSVNEVQSSRQIEYEVASDHRVLHKTQLDEDVKTLVRRLQDMESTMHRRDLDAASRVSELEGSVRRLELEREQLLSTIETVKTRHNEELTNIDISHKSHLKTLEESYQRREQRLKDETELIIAQSNEKIKNLEAEKADLEGSNNRKIVILETAKNGEIERLKDVHRCALEQFRQEHEEEMQHLRKLKDQEVSAATSAHAHTRSLQALMDQVLNSTREVSDLRQKIEITHKSGLDERELSARARDEYLKQLQERLLRQQSENDEERARLQGLVAKMELHMREQSRQVDQERWRLSQEESRLKALQGALEDERRVTMEQLSSQRAEVQRAREDLVREQRTTISQIQEERRTVATERAQLSSAHKELINQEKKRTESSVQVEADLGATAVKIKEEAAVMAVREAQIRQEEERLRRDKREFDRERSLFDEEKERIGKLGLEVQKKSLEIEELCSNSVRIRDEGEQALELAERLRVSAEAQRTEADGALLVVQEKERQLAQDRLAIAHERRLLEKDKQTGRCWQCEGRRAAPSPTVEQMHTSDSPVVDTSLPTLPFVSSGTPDLLVNSLEFKRSLRRWTHDKEKDEEFLEQEAQFLDRLQRFRDTSKQRPSSSLNSTVY